MRDPQLLIRTVTGLTIVVIVIALTLTTTLGTMLLILAIVGAGAFEFYRMQPGVQGNSVLPQVLLTIAPVAVVIGSLNIPELTLPNLVVLPALIAVLMMVAFMLQLRNELEVIYRRTAAYAFAVVLFAIPGICAIFLAQSTPVLVLGIFVLLWSGDVWAYLGGRMFGKHQLAPTVSPKKTWEGVLVGVIATAVAAFVMSRIVREIDLTSWIIMAVLAVIFGTTGDLMQSAVKRASGVKDSGGLLPGHGGVWDRFDSFLGCVSWITLYYFLV
jgi:phosphatidate cytidylyltransferase